LVAPAARALQVPAVVLEIVAGIVVGPSVLGWVEVDATIEVLATLGVQTPRRRCRSSSPPRRSGQELGLIGAGESAALVGAGLLSVLLFPPPDSRC
jgi:Sodium/hydrogen exchanger family